MTGYELTTLKSNKTAKKGRQNFLNIQITSYLERRHDEVNQHPQPPAGSYEQEPVTSVDVHKSIKLIRHVLFLFVGVNRTQTAKCHSHVAKHWTPRWKQTLTISICTGKFHSHR